MGRIVFLALLCWLTARCTNEVRNFTQQPAPQKEQDLGWMVTLSSAELKDLIQNHPEAKIRAISLEQNLYEVSGITEEALKQKTTDQNLSKNEFLKSEQTLETPPLEKLIQNSASEAQIAISTCRQTATAPELSISSLNLPPNLTLELGEALKVQTFAQPHPKTTGDVRVLWSLMPPAFSEQKLENAIGHQQEFTPQSVGFYRLAIVAQGTDLSCRISILPFFVTSNPELQAFNINGQFPPTNAFLHLTQIQAPEAWKISQGEGVTVAVIDTGVNYNHPAIRDNLAFKTTETLDGVDSDDNGFIDDYMGWDFINGDNLPFDDEGHGSHVSGLISSPVMGVAPKSKVLPIKALNAAGSSDVATIAAAIYYAVDNGAKIINLSMGFEGMALPPFRLKQALDYARVKNVLVLSAAGNGDRSGRGYNIEQHPNYPASFMGDNLMTIASTMRGQLTRYSNFSEKLVQLAAPGGDNHSMIYSLTTQNAMNLALAPQSGTSMATPVAAGVAALLWSVRPELTPAQIKEALIKSGTELPSLNEKVSSGRQVNALQALQSQLDLEPALAAN